MAIVRVSELQKTPKAEIDAKLRELRTELMKLQSQKSTGTLASPGKIKAIKKAIAKINTVRQRKL